MMQGAQSWCYENLEELEVGGRFKAWEEAYVYLGWFVWQKPIQHYKAIILQLKISKLKKKTRSIHKPQVDKYQDICLH